MRRPHAVVWRPTSASGHLSCSPQETLQPWPLTGHGPEITQAFKFQPRARPGRARRGHSGGAAGARRGRAPSRGWGCVGGGLTAEDPSPPGPW